MAAQELRFMQSHEWACLDESGRTVTVGISDFAVEQLGDIVFLELPPLGGQVESGRPFGTIESVKAATDLYAPAGGNVVGVNESLPDNLDLFKSDPYGQAWLIQIELTDLTELDGLMGPDDYQAYCQTQR